MRRATAAEVDRLLVSLEPHGPELDGVRDRAHQYATECGCSSGGVGLVIAAFTAPVVLTLKSAWSPLAVLYALLAVAVASLAGKAAGIGVAAARLHLLHRSLQRRLRSMQLRLQLSLQHDARRHEE